MLRSSTLSDCQWARSPCRRRSWALCPGRRLAPPLSSRGACQHPRVGPAVPGRTGRLPPRRMGSHAVFLAQRARASPFLYDAFRVLTAAWKRKEETLPPQSPRAHEGPRGAMQRPCGQCRVSPTTPPSPQSPRRLGGDGPQAGTSASIAAAASPPRRWGGGAGGRRAQPGRAPPPPSDAVLPLQTRPASPARSQEAHALGQGRSHRQPALSNVPRPRGGPRRLAAPSCVPQLCRTASGLAHPVGGGPGRCARAAAWPRHPQAAELVSNPASGRPTRGGRAGYLRAAWARTRSSRLSWPGLASSCTARVSSGRVIRFDRCSSLLAPADGGGLAFAAPSRAGPCRPFAPTFCPGGAPARCCCRLFDAHCWPRPRPRAAWRRVRGNAFSSAPPGFAAPRRAGPVDYLRRRSASLEAHPLVAVSDLLSCHSDSSSQEPEASALSRTWCISAQRRSWPWKSDPVSSSADLPAADSDPFVRDDLCRPWARPHGDPRSRFLAHVDRQARHRENGSRTHPSPLRRQPEVTAKYLVS